MPGSSIPGTEVKPIRLPETANPDIYSHTYLANIYVLVSSGLKPARNYEA